MPRRNYNSGRGRRRPQTYGGAVIDRLEAEAKRRRSTTDEPNRADELVHRPHCDEPNVGTFTGTRGDRMARCNTCGANRVLTHNLRSDNP